MDAADERRLQLFLLLSFPIHHPSIVSFHSPAPLLLSHTSLPLSFFEPTNLLLFPFFSDLISGRLSRHCSLSRHTALGFCCSVCLFAAGSWLASVLRRAAWQISSLVVIPSQWRDTTSPPIWPTRGDRYHCCHTSLLSASHLSVCWPETREKHVCLVFACLFPQPFGVNQPGPYVMYTTVDSNGELKNASGKSFLSAAPHWRSSHKSCRSDSQEKKGWLFHCTSPLLIR